MTNRVTPPDVQRIFTTSSDDETIDYHISLANRYVTDQLTGKGLSDERLTDIELYVAAHFLAISFPNEGNNVRERLGDAENEHTPITGEGLHSTRYGQMAISLDTSGTLTALDKPRARFSVFGKTTTCTE